VSFARAEDAIAWLRESDAHPWLVRHHELVLEAATDLLDGLERTCGLHVDRRFVLVGAALHDAGKMLHPSEMSAPGNRHEDDGVDLLSRAGADDVSRVARTHARWSEVGARLEDRLIAAADKLWKGKRDEALEAALVDEIANMLGRPRWETFAAFDEIAADVAGGGPDRLARSIV